MTSANDMQIVQFELDPEKAKEDFYKYQNHPLQPTGYNVFFHNPPLNPENRVLIDEGGERQKVLLEGHMEPLTWKYEQLGEVWDWAVTDVWAWMETNDDKLYHITFTTVKYELNRIYKVRDYFYRNLKEETNIYVNHPEYLPKNKDFREHYKDEINRLNTKAYELGVGFIKRDKIDDYLLFACLPEENLSNEILEKWHPMLGDFAKTSLECLNFTQGEIS